MLEIRRDAKNIRRLSKNSSMAEIRAIRGQLSDLIQVQRVVQTSLTEVNGKLREVSGEQQSIVQGTN